MENNTSTQSCKHSHLTTSLKIYHNIRNSAGELWALTKCPLITDENIEDIPDQSFLTWLSDMVNPKISRRTISNYEFTDMMSCWRSVHFKQRTKNSLHDKLLDQNFKSQIKLSKIKIRQFENKRDENHKAHSFEQSSGRSQHRIGVSMSQLFIHES